MSCENKDIYKFSSEELAGHLALHRSLTEAIRFRNVTGFFLDGSLNDTGLLEQDHHFSQADKLEKALDKKQAEAE